MENPQSVSRALDQWLAIHAIGRRPRTVAFHLEIVGIIRRDWRDLAAPASSITVDQVTEFAQRVAHYCPSRWNAIVTILHQIAPAARVLRRRPLRFRQFTPPNQEQFAQLLDECDRAPRSRAGLVIRFLAFTGLRISEARALTWSNVFSDRIEVPAFNTKNGRARSVPIVPGCAELLDRLRGLDAGVHVLPRESIRTALKTACRRTGLSRMSHHSFRHLFATRCIESGVDVPTVARWLGHQDGGSLLSRMYFHLLDDHGRRMAERVRIDA